MFENPKRGRQARNFTTNVPKILDLKSSSEQIFFRKLSLGAPEETEKENWMFCKVYKENQKELEKCTTSIVCASYEIDLQQKQSW